MFHDGHAVSLVRVQLAAKEEDVTSLKLSIRPLTAGSTIGPLLLDKVLHPCVSHLCKSYLCHFRPVSLWLCLTIDPLANSAAIPRDQVRNAAVLAADKTSSPSSSSEGKVMDNHRL
eukprot:COSAG02_NODE_26174_length_639_cov_0.779630_1_plen_115_part_10